MTYLVPFDGGALSRAALERAATFGSVLDEPVVAVTVVPRGNGPYARDRGWLDPDEEFDLVRVESALRSQVAAVAPNASFRLRTAGRHDPPGQIAAEIRRAADEVGATIVFLGSDNAGRVVSSVASVGRSVAADDAYDVMIVRRTADRRRRASSSGRGRKDS